MSFGSTRDAACLSAERVCGRDDNKCVRYENYSDVIAVKHADALNDGADRPRRSRRCPRSSRWDDVNAAVSLRCCQDLPSV